MYVHTCPIVLGLPDLLAPLHKRCSWNVGHTKHPYVQYVRTYVYENCVQKDMDDSFRHRTAITPLALILPRWKWYFSCVNID